MRSFPVTLLAVVVLFFTVLNGLRLSGALANWQILAQYAPWPGPLYMTMTGLVWTLLGAALTFGLWRTLPWARRLGQIASPAYLLYYWMDRLVLQSGVPNTNTPFMLVFSALLTLACLGILLDKSPFQKREA